MDKGLPARILIYADNDEEREVLFNVLVGQGYAVHKLEKPEEALLTFHQVVPDILILAESGPVVLSNEAARRLTEQSEIAEIPALFVCNGNSSLESLSGVDVVVDYLHRPFEREEVLARVKILLKITQQYRELNEMREKLHNAQKLECVGALAAGVAHEFNNMMCAVMGFAELALQEGAVDVDALKESAEISYETAKRAAATAKSLLAFSRQATSLKSMTNVNDAIMGAVKLLMRDMDKSGITIVRDLGELPESVMSIGSMQQVFLNLIINAWHALTEWHGEKKVTIVSRSEDNQKIIVTVTDTGMGIHKSRHEKIFEPFYTTKVGTNPGEIKGSGLGLAIVKEVIRDHGGTIRVDSEEGKGATFVITLPVEKVSWHEGQGQVFNADAFSLPKGSRYTVLVVDDEEQNRRAISLMLKKNGHEVFSASNMAEAAKLAWSNKLDIVVLDLVMPGSAGCENVKSLRDQGFDFPIMICTGNTDEISIKRALDAGADGLVTKPFSATEFLSEMYACILGEKKPDGPGKI